MASVLTPQQVADFGRDGYIVFDPQIDTAVLDAIPTELRPHWRAPARVEDGVYMAPDRIQDAWRSSANVKSVATHPVVLAALGQLYGRTPRPFQTLNFPVGTEQKPHSDTVHFNSEPASYMCGVWVALEDIDLDNGPLVYYPGSQKLPEVKIGDLAPEARRRASWFYRRVVHRLRHWNGSSRRPPFDVYAEIYAPFYEPHIADLIRRHALQPRYGTLRKGQALIWASNLLHGGAPQRDRARSRLSQVTHYFFAGCRYYTPLLETRDLLGRTRTQWRDPAWIV